MEIRKVFEERGIPLSLLHLKGPKVDSWAIAVSPYEIHTDGVKKWWWDQGNKLCSTVSGQTVVVVTREEGIIGEPYTQIQGIYV